MLQALVDVTVQGSKCSADFNHYRQYPHRRDPTHNYQQNYQDSQNGEKNEGSKNAPEGQAGPTVPVLLQATIPSLLYAEILWATATVSQPSGCEKK